MILDELITDRTQADVDSLLALYAKGWDAMSAEEQTAFLDDSKGAYTPSDLNRVEEAIDYVADKLNDVKTVVNNERTLQGVAADLLTDVPYDFMSIVTKTDWAEADAPAPRTELERYVANISAVCNAIRNRLSIATADGFTWRTANAIESAILSSFQDAEELRVSLLRNITNASQSWFYSGEIYAGESI